MNARNKSFLKASLTTKDNRATKRNLRVAIVDKLDRGHLKMHADGGTRHARRANIAIPSRAVKKTGRGVAKSMRPTALANSFRKGDILYQRIGAKGRNLKLVYVLKPSAPIRGKVPFRASFRLTMSVEVWKAFYPRLRAAMQTRR